MIENPGECSIEELTILGLSTAREDTDKIGQFGSGSKHAINVLLRNGINPTIYLGKQKVEFFAEPRRTNDKNYSIVCYRIGTKKVSTGFALEYGELDWGAIDMSLREFVSNAIDSVDDASKVNITTTDNTRAKSGTTRVFVPLTPDVQRFYNELFDRFLNFDERKNQTILEKTEKGPAKIYRKGVLVRQLDSHKDSSLFDYNLGEDLQIDESRNLDDYSVQSACARRIRKDTDSLSTIFQALRRDDVIWEGRFNQYSLVSYKSEDKEVWQNAWKNAFGNAYLCQACDKYASDRATALGNKVVTIDNGEWYTSCRKMGIPTVYDVITDLESKGCVPCEATPNAIATMGEVWSWFNTLGVTRDKDCPRLKCFKQTQMGEDPIVFGYYDQKQDTVYINVEFDTNKKTYVEELIHYVGEVEDFSRNFQEFTIDMIVSACS